ncbi:hypothetical protein F5Y19DRAFT_319188 [Xylariaceae sp. FL1651]|nr:hypothetical protein F5Y19DRAFT_319188 [Xylariaceae sp. FL1651]
MSPSLSSVPLEILYAIVSSLLLPDQAALARTSKHLNHLLTPVIWSDIELHHSGTHEGINIEGEIEALKFGDFNVRMAEAMANDVQYPYKQLVFKPSERKYSQCHFDPPTWKKSFSPFRRSKSTRATDNFNRRNFQFGREEKFIGTSKVTSRERWAELARHIRSLCISIAIDDEVAETLASLTELRSLELVGLPLEGGHPPNAPNMIFPKLQNLKLRGYFPAALVREICNNAVHISHLDLGLLATATDDKAYMANLLENDDSHAIISEQEAEHYQQNGSEAVAIALQSTEMVNSDEETADNHGDKISDDDNNEEDDDDEEEDDEEDLPWALHSPIWLPRSLPSMFSSLTHLHLVKPYTGETNLLFAHDSFLHVPHRYEQVLCLEWVALLQGVGNTLRELILEHRIPMHVGDTVGDGDSVPECKGGNRINSYFGFSSVNTDRGDRLFCRSVLRLLLEQSSLFPRLEHLTFRGIQIKGLPTRKGVNEVPGKDGAPDNDELLHELYPQCDIEIFEDAYPIHVYAGHIYQNWPLNRHEAMQDEGDGLMWDLSYFNDYKRRFGPQWRIRR